MPNLPSCATAWCTADTLRVLDVVEGTVVDGPGLRTTIYFAGCSHHCPGCHNPQSWDPRGGTLTSVAALMEQIVDAGFNVTFSGGDPLLQIKALLPLARAVKQAGFTLWVYTGYTIEQIEDDEKLRPVLEVADAIVDGPYVAALRDTSLRFRGSKNQRIIELPKR